MLSKRYEKKELRMNDKFPICQQDLISSLRRAIQEKSTKNRGLFSTSSSARNLFYDVLAKEEWQTLMAAVSDNYDTFYELQPAH